MDFVYCSKCGTRNFKEDKNCGVCGNDLHQHSIGTENKQRNYLPLIVIASVFIIVGYYLFKPSEKDKVQPEIGTSYVGTKEGLNSTLENVEYKIQKIRLNIKRGFDIDVTIGHKLSEDDLLALAERIKKEAKVDTKKGVIGFYLPHMEIGNGSWAIITYSPSPIVNYFGATISEEQGMRQNAKKDDDCIGIWLDDTKQGDIAIRIRKDESGNYFYEYVSIVNPRNSPLATKIIKSKRKGKTIYLDTEHPEQYFFINKDGDLEVYDNFGYFATFRRSR